jgi:riboflavin kinase / FMN adenylyltransferase
VKVMTLQASMPANGGRDLALGFFDGLHLGHQALIGCAVERARLGGESAVFTFLEHPLEVLAPDRAPLLLSPLPEKQALLTALGVDSLILAPFTTQLAALTPAAFVDEVLVGCLQVRSVVVGPNYRFGKGAQGTPESLVELGKQHGFAVEVVRPVDLDGALISSTRVRELLTAGEVAQAGRLLGRPYSVRGVVEHGDARGRRLGFATANLAPPPRKQMPARGVYAVSVPLPAGLVWGVANLGTRPTFDGGACLLEVHLLDFEGDLYDQKLEVRFHEYLRPERRFDGVEALLTQIRLDVEAARACLAQALIASPTT